MRGCLFLVLGAVALLVLAGFSFNAYMSWHWESRATRQALAAEAVTVLKSVPLRPNDLLEPAEFVPPDRWPTTIPSLKPSNVVVRKDGLYVETREVFVDESGYFVPRDGTRFKPPHGAGLSFTPLGDGVWWYHLAD